MRVGAATLLLWVVVAPACGDRAYECQQDVQCVSNKGRGYCEVNGLCSFPDATCPSGRRYGDHAGDESGTCVSADDVLTTTGEPIPDPGVNASGSTSGGSTGGGSDSESGSDGDPPCTWDEPQWTHRVRITPSNAVADSAFDDHVVLVLLDETRVDHAVAAPEGADLRFVREDDGTELPHEIERWDARGPGARSAVWVRWGELANEDDAVLMYFGNPDAAPSWTPADVWPDDYELVTHLDAPVGDATESNPMSVHGPVLADGRIAGGQELEAQDEYIDVGSGAGIDDVFATGGTITAWIFPEEWGGGSYGRIADKSNGLNAEAGWSLMVSDDDGGTIELRRDLGPIVIWRAEPDAIELGKWQWVVVMLDETQPSVGASIYVDGAPVGVTQLGEPNQNDIASDAEHSLWIGNRTSLEGRAFDGTLDELRIARTVRSPAFVQTQHRSMTDTLLSYGELETRPPECD